MVLFLLIPWFAGSLLLLLGMGLAKGQPPLTEWTTAYNLEKDHVIVKNGLLTTLSNMTKEWRVTFDVKPEDYVFRGYANVLHMTIGGKGLGGNAKVGDRTPIVWIHKTHGVVISSALNGKASYSKKVASLPPVGEWTTIEVSQSLVGTKYFYSISIGNKNALKVENKKPVEHSKVKVFAGSPWYTARKGFLRNLEVQIKVPNCVLAGESNEYF